MSKTLLKWMKKSFIKQKDSQISQIIKIADEENKLSSTSAISFLL